MAYNEKTADRIREALSHLPNVEEKRMFGGIAFLVNDKMCINVGNGRIMCRIDPGIYDEVIEKKDCRPIVMKGRELKGYVDVDEEHIQRKKELDYWIGLSLDYNKIAKSSKSKK